MGKKRQGRKIILDISHIFLVPFKVPKGIFKWHFEFLKLCLIGH